MRLTRARRLAPAGMVAVVALAAFLLIRFRSGGAHDPRVVEMFGGDSGLAAVTQPAKVEAYRLGPYPDPQGTDTRDYPVLAGPITVPTEKAAALSRVLQSADSYGWDHAKGCIPTYGVRLSFCRGRDRVDVLLCMSCDVLLVERNGVVTGGEDFDPIRPVVVDAVKAIFPSDAAIQALDRRGGRRVPNL